MFLSVAAAGLAPPPLASQAWLLPGAFPAAPLHRIAEQIDELNVADLALVKAFDAQNSADAAFATDAPSVQWLSTPAMRSPVLLGAETLLEALENVARAPLSARVASAKHGAVTSELDDWLAALAAQTGRAHRDADAYMTPGPPHGSTSASLGWHIDDVDVLLVMLRGTKRFRVAGTAAGSELCIDHVMSCGDAIYIPALTFHSGGDSAGTAASATGAVAASSTMLSVAMPPRDARATDVVGEWRRARDAVRRRLPDRDSNSWQWASGAEGAEAVSRTLRENAKWRRFALEHCQ